MGTKDIAEKVLADYNDVFADIVNVLLFDGKAIVREEQLESAKDKSVYKADEQIREQERDVAKLWKNNGIRLSFFGLEHQTDSEKYMPLRIIGYDGAVYRAQLIKGAQKRKYPSVTMVLYFGTEHRWNQPERLSECLEIPPELQPFFSDYRINVYDIAFLPDHKVAMFKSDFRIVADYFVQMRKNRDYQPSREEIAHVDEVLKLMSVLTGDHRFEDVQNEGKRVHNMCEVLDRAEARGKVQGMDEGINLTISIYSMLKAGETAEKIAQALGIELDTVLRIQKTL